MEGKTGRIDSVDWVRTIGLQLARGYSTGLVITFALSFSPDMEFGTLLFVPFFAAIAALVFGTAFNVGAYFMGNIHAVAGRATAIVGALAICPGDPILYTLQRFRPQLFDFPGLKPINLEPVVLIPLQRIRGNNLEEENSR